MHEPMEPFIPRAGEEINNPVGVAERLVNFNKHVIHWGLTHVDDSSVISKELAKEVFSKYVHVQTLLRKDKDGGSTMIKTGHGHGGFIRGKTLQSSLGGTTSNSFAVYPITAKHNLRAVTDTSTPTCHYRLESAYLVLSSSDQVAVSWSDNMLGWEPTKSDCFNLREGVEARAMFV